MNKFMRTIAILFGVKTEPSAEQIILAELERQHRLHKLELEVLQKSSCLGRRGCYENR